MDGLYFLDQKHYGAYQVRKNLVKTSGVFLDIVVEYLGGYAALHYRDLDSVRGSLVPWFTFLGEIGITDLNAVVPKTVTQYLAWSTKSGRKNASRFISCVSMFFRWAIVEGYRTAGNPVVPRIHNMQTPRRLPRPLAAALRKLKKLKKQPSAMRIVTGPGLYVLLIFLSPAILLTDTRATPVVFVSTGTSTSVPIASSLRDD
jgi:hypothetical protein